MPPTLQVLPALKNSSKLAGTLRNAEELSETLRSSQTVSGTIRISQELTRTLRKPQERSLILTDSQECLARKQQGCTRRGERGRGGGNAQREWVELEGGGERRKGERAGPRWRKRHSRTQLGGWGGWRWRRRSVARAPRTRHSQRHCKTKTGKRPSGRPRGGQGKMHHVAPFPRSFFPVLM